MLVRPALAADAEQAASVLRRSISELCVADHGDDPRVLGQWLRNKTPDTVRIWIEAPDRQILVAEEDGILLGVGAASQAGEIILNYVAPEARFRGVSRALVRTLEAYLRDLGRTESRLTSTRTAHAFYLSMGYADAGDLDTSTTVPGQPMRKSL